MTPLHRASGTYDGEDDANSQGKVLIDYVDALRKVCDKYSIPIIDTYLISGINPNISEIGSEYFADGLHISMIIGFIVGVGATVVSIVVIEDLQNKKGTLR